MTFLTLQRWLASTGPALLAALLLAVHPTKAESVAWISGRPDLMCLVFMLVATAGAGRRLRGERSGLALEVVGTLGAYLSKETALALPAFLFVEHWIAAGRPALDAAVMRGLVRGAVPQIAVAAAYLGARALFLPLGEAATSQVELRRWANRPGLVLETFGRATELIFAPHDLHVQRGLFTYDSNGKLILSWPYIALGFLCLSGIVAIGVACRRRLPLVTLGLLIFLVGFLPTSNLKPTGLLTILSDRYLYIPLFGIGVALSVLFSVWLRRARPLVPLAATGAAAAALAFGSLSRAADYSDEDAYWAHELEVNPISVEAMRHKISLLTRHAEYDEALRWFLRAHQISHQFKDPRSDLKLFVEALELLAFLTPDADEAELRRIADFYQQLLDAKPADAELIHSRARIKLTIRPRMKRLLENNWPSINMAKAKLMSRLGEDAEAIRLVENTFRICPDCRAFLLQAPLIFAAAGQYARAHQSFDRYVALTGEPEAAAQNQLLVEEAERWAKTVRNAQGPAAVHARAMELSSLGLFGRSFEVMKPYEREFIDVPDVALGYADLAWRAGHRDTARAVLARHLSPSEANATIARWQEALGQTRD